MWGRNSHGRIRWARDVYRANVGSHDFQNGGLNVSVCDSLDVAVAHCESKVPEVPEDGGERRIEICQFFFALLLRMRRENRIPTPYLHHHSPFLSQIDRGLLPML